MKEYNLGIFVNVIHQTKRCNCGGNMTLHEEGTHYLASLPENAGLTVAVYSCSNDCAGLNPTLFPVTGICIRCPGGCGKETIVLAQCADVLTDNSFGYDRCKMPCGCYVGPSLMPALRERLRKADRRPIRNLSPPYDVFGECMKPQERIKPEKAPAAETEAL